MQVIIEDSLIDEIKKETKSKDLTIALKELLKNYKIYKKTKKIAKDINLALKEIKNGKTYDIKSILDEV